jgi:hypothetical protein
MTTRMKVQNDQFVQSRKNAVSVIWMKMLQWTQYGQLQAQALHDSQPLGSTTPFLIVYFMPLHKDYIQMSFFLKIHRWKILKLGLKSIFFKNIMSTFYNS